MKKRKGLSAVNRAALLIFGLALAVWLIVGYIITGIVARQRYDLTYASCVNYIDNFANVAMLDRYYDPSSPLYGYQHERPDEFEYYLFNALEVAADYPVSVNYGTRFTAGGYKSTLTNNACSVSSAVVFYDRDGNVIHGVDDDVLFFAYYTEQEVKNGKADGAGLHYAYIDISSNKGEYNDALAELRGMGTVVGHTSTLGALRIDGCFEGTRLIPARIQKNFNGSGEAAGATLSQKYDRKLFNWLTMYEDPGVAARGDLVTVYIDLARSWYYLYSPVKVGSDSAENLAEFAKGYDFTDYETGTMRHNVEVSTKLDSLILLSRRDYFYEDYETPELTMVTAFSFNALKWAIGALENVYILTAFAIFAAAAVIFFCLKDRVISPVAEISRSAELGWVDIKRPEDAPPVWREVESLQRDYIEECDTRRALRNEVSKMKASLRYADEAEKNRRELISAIAHELKTPLAVISGYAEGLKEQIAEDKRDQYLETIISETGRMDAIVLEMLDLSRLEAGKVKLARDEFSLGDMARSVFGKLEMAIGSKELKLDMDIADDTVLIADEGRILQAVENFATNAVKYSPRGGRVSVSVHKTRRDICFSVDNQCRSFTSQELDKIWDAFYRADPDRSGEGTGLGLAITKNIIELHGGQCRAKNVEGGVSFSFTLPV